MRKWSGKFKRKILPRSNVYTTSLSDLRSTLVKVASLRRSSRITATVASFAEISMLPKFASNCPPTNNLPRPMPFKDVMDVMKANPSIIACHPGRSMLLCLLSKVKRLIYQKKVGLYSILTVQTK